MNKFCELNSGGIEIINNLYMLRFFSTANKLPIHVTETAWARMSDVIKENVDHRFIFTANGGGCNGFKYKLSLMNEITYNEIYGIPNDVTKMDRIKYTNNIKTHLPTTLHKNNVKVTIDPVAEMILLGTTIDYIKKDYTKGIFENKFVFTPNKTMGSSCGCGISFQPYDID